MKLKDELTPLTERIAALPVSESGYPVPWFVAWVDGKPEFRAADPHKFNQAVGNQLCWVCGQRLGAHKTFVIGPMCGVNRTTAEPPCHTDCAEWSVKNCPFLSKPNMVRREKGLDEVGVRDPAGVMIKRNPGVSLLWTTKYYKLFRADPGYLIHMGPHTKLAWYREGRPATEAEIRAAIESGLPALMAMAEQEGPQSVAQLHKAVQTFEEAWLRELKGVVPGMSGPCKQCEGNMEMGIMLIAVRDGESGENPYRTGELHVITEDAAKRWFDGSPVLEKILKKRCTFIEESSLRKLGVPKPEVKNGG